MTFAGGKRVGEIEAAYRAVMDAQPAVSRCALCDWQTEGTAASCREAFAVHRAHVHPETLVKRAKVKRPAVVAMSPRGRTTSPEERERNVVLAGRRAEDARKRGLTERCSDGSVDSRPPAQAVGSALSPSGGGGTASRSVSPRRVRSTNITKAPRIGRPPVLGNVCGTALGYFSRGCRCPRCKTAARDYNAARWQEKKDGYAAAREANRSAA